MASRPRTTGAPARLHAAAREGMAGSSGCRHSAHPRLKPTTTTAHADDAGEQVCVNHVTASTPFVLAASRLRALRVDPAPHSTLLENRRPSSKHAQTKGVDGPAPFRNGTTRRLGSRSTGPRSTSRHHLTSGVRVRHEGASLCHPNRASTRITRLPGPSPSRRVSAFCGDPRRDIARRRPPPG